ncbi:MAG: acyl-CoA dehydrogenase family protein [Rhodospirillales bacterium]
MPDRSFLGWPFFEGAHRALAAEVDDFAAKNVRNDCHGDHDLDGDCRTLVARLAEAGLLKFTVPAPWGGLSDRLDVRSLCLIRETLARHNGLADFAFAMQGLGGGPVSLYGTDDQRARYLPEIAAGKLIAAFALSEPAGGSDVAAMATTARRDGNHFVLDGEKTWISNGGIAGLYIVFARTGEAPGAKGLSAFIVEADNPGLEIAERIDVSAPHPLARLAFESCRVPADAMIGEGGQGFRIAMGTLDVFRSTVGAAALGFARRALDEALDRASTRELFGAPMAELQLVQGRIADMAVAVDAAALMVYRAAWTKDSGADRVTREASMAKLFATEEAQKVVDGAVQIMGGHGVVAGSPVERLYRDVRALRIYEGASEIQQIVIARQTLAAHASGDTA